MKWTKSKLDKFTSEQAIMCKHYHIARFVTYINGEKIERYLLSDCSELPHKSLKWADSSQELKDYAEKIINAKK